MFKKVILPNSKNYIIWLNALFLLYLLFFSNINPATIVFAYFIETNIIGFFHMLKMASATAYEVSLYGRKSTLGKRNLKKGAGATLFFIVHFGMFVFAQNFIVFQFFDQLIPGITPESNFFEKVGLMFQLDGMLEVLLSIFLLNLVLFLKNFIFTKEYKKNSPGEILFNPYLRVFTQQVIVLFSGVFLVFFPKQIAIALMVILIRLFVDLVLNGSENDKMPIEKVMSFIFYSGSKKK